MHGYCISCFSNKPQKSLEHLHEFKADNLRYLEELEQDRANGFRRA